MILLYIHSHTIYIHNHTNWAFGISALLCFCFYFWSKFVLRYQVSWFYPAKCGRGVASWEDVRLLLKMDPLERLTGFRITDKKTIFVDCFTFLAALWILALIEFYAFDPHFPGWLENDFGGIASAEFNPILPAILALAGTIYAAVSQLNSKVRSENRQKWINDVRDTIALIIDKVPQINPLPTEMADTSCANRARARLELLMNPSERDHRTLGVLLRVACKSSPINIDDSVWRGLKIERSYIDPWEIACNLNDKERERRRDALISMIIKLSNAMLKREWERVKFGR